MTPSDDAVRALYVAANDVCACAGFHGQISGRDDRIVALMAALATIDGGTFDPAIAAAQSETTATSHTADSSVAHSEVKPDDRELLEKAAKAAGLSVRWVETPGPWGLDEFRIDGASWNPLTDDGDALRLAVWLRLHLDFGTHESLPYVCANRNGIEGVIDPVSVVEDLYDDEGNPNSIVRRAIVRAAASIGEQ